MVILLPHAILKIPVVSDSHARILAGDSGLTGMFSDFGSFGVSPYTDEDDAHITFLMPESLAAVKTFNVPVTFVSFELIGSLMLRGTLGRAAW